MVPAGTGVRGPGSAVPITTFGGVPADTLLPHLGARTPSPQNTAARPMEFVIHPPVESERLDRIAAAAGPVAVVIRANLRRFVPPRIIPD